MAVLKPDDSLSLREWGYFLKVIQQQCERRTPPRMMRHCPTTRDGSLSYHGVMSGELWDASSWRTHQSPCAPPRGQEAGV